MVEPLHGAHRLKELDGEIEWPFFSRNYSHGRRVLREQSLDASVVDFGDPFIGRSSEKASGVLLDSGTFGVGNVGTPKKDMGVKTIRAQAA